MSGGTLTGSATEKEIVLNVVVCPDVVRALRFPSIVQGWGTIVLWVDR